MKLRTMRMITGATLGLAALLFMWMSDGTDHTSRSERERTSQSQNGPNPPPASDGIAERPVDPANYIATEQSIDPTRQRELAVQADHSGDLLAALKAGDPQWQATLIDMDFSDLANDIYLECSARHLRQPCTYEIDYVIEYKEPGVGQIVYGRAVMDKIYSQDCEQYVKCMVKGNLGASVVLDPAIHQSFARRKTQTDNYPDVTLEELEEMLSIMEAGVAEMEKRGPDGQPDWEYRLELERSYLYLIRKRIEEKRG